MSISRVTLGILAVVVLGGPTLTVDHLIIAFAGSTFLRAVLLIGVLRRQTLARWIGRRDDRWQVGTVVK